MIEPVIWSETLKLKQREGQNKRLFIDRNRYLYIERFIVGETLGD